MDTVRFASGVPLATAGNGKAATPAVPALPGASGGAGSVPASAAASTVEARGIGQATATTVATGSQQSREQLQALLDQVSRHIDPERRTLSFRLSEELGRAIVSVYDAETDELIRQIPAETMVRIASTMRELARQGSEGNATSGLLLSEQA